jgi:hypothetical protein
VRVGDDQDSHGSHTSPYPPTSSSAGVRSRLSNGFSVPRVVVVGERILA